MNFNSHPRSRGIFYNTISCTARSSPDSNGSDTEEIKYPFMGLALFSSPPSIFIHLTNLLLGQQFHFVGNDITFKINFGSVIKLFYFIL